MSVWDFIAGWPLWFQIVFVIMIVILLYFIIRKGIEFSKGQTLFKIGSKGIQKEYVSPHRNCPYSKDILLLLNELDKLRSEKWHIMYIDQMKHQLNFAEQRVEQIKSMLQKKYLQILSEKNLPQLVSSESYIAYQLILKSGMQEMMKLLRMAFKENHFDSMGEKEFSSYLSDKSDFLLTMGSDILNDTYFINKDVTREELYSRNQEITSKLKEIIIDIFENARDVSLQNKIKLMELDERMDRLIQKYI